MVPFTSKAFFEGELQPVSASSNDTTAAEQIVVNVGGGKLEEMSRANACAYIDKQLDELHKSKAKLKKSVKSSFKKGFLVNKTNRVDGKKNPTLSKNESNVSQEMLLQEESKFPLMEIREECDIRGNIVNSEVINMSDTMKRIDSSLKDNGNFANVDVSDDGDGEKLGKLLVDTLNDSQAEIRKGFNNISLEEDQAESNVEVIKKGPVSDKDYEAILQRLEELKEEEDANSKKVNKTSSKRLQSSGWSKGFLNTGETNVSKTKQIKVDATKKSISSSPSNKSYEDIQAKKNPKVSFSSSNEVKEIPRIGMNRLPQKSISTNAIATSNAARIAPDSPSDLDPFTPRSTIPFEDNVFRGVVKERKCLTTSANDEIPQDVAGKKKLSRFAQQRLQREENR